MSTSKKIAKEKQDNLGYTLWHMFCNAPVHVIDKAEDAFLKLYGNAEKISWLPGPVKSNIRGFTGDTSKGYGNDLFEIKYGINGAIARGGLDFVLESAKGVFELAEEAEKTSKLAKETETTLGATTIESVKAAEQAGEEAKAVSGIDRAKDTLERLKKWEEPGVDELKITKTGETVNGASKTSYGKSTLNSLKNTENFTNSAIEHIFEGQVNARGRAVGYHYEGIENTAGKVIAGTESTANNLGVYQAQVEVSGIAKSVNNGYSSSFFPKNMNPQEVINNINQAYTNRVFIRGNRYRGISSGGIEIEMFLDNNNKIISAFPIY